MVPDSGNITAAAEGIRFVESDDPAIAAVRVGPASGAAVDWFSGGVVFRDIDGDGIADLFVGRTSEVNPEGRGTTLLIGQNDGTFVDRTEDAGLVYDGPAVAVVAADIDADGRVDLYVATDGDGDRLYLQRAPLLFEEVAEAAGVRGLGRRTRSVSIFDYDQDGRLDLYVTDWNGQGPLGMDGAASSWDAPNVLYKNNGDGTFTDRTAEAGVDCAGRSSLGVTAADLDADGDAELYIANEFFDDCFYDNMGDGTFVEASATAGVGTHANGGMGVAVGDPDFDGDLDLIVTDDLYDDGARGNPFYVNLGALRFANRAMDWGLEGAESVDQTSAVYWGVGFVDFDLDGIVDLHMAQHSTGPDHLFVRTPREERFERVSAERFSLEADVRGSAYADMDLDGRVDIAEVARNGSLHLLRNVGGVGNGHLRITLEGPAGNREGIGSTIQVGACGRQTAYAVQAGSSYLSSSEPAVTAGVGTCAEPISVRVVFPGGQERRVEIAAGQTQASVAL